MLTLEYDGIEIDMGIITSYSESFSKSVSKFPIVSRSTPDTFAIETSSNSEITFDYVRRSPDSPDDNAIDSTDWSTPRWVEEMDLAMDRWQAESDGFTLRYNLDRELPGMPSREIGGYVRSFSYRFKAGDVQCVYGSVTFSTGTMHCKCRRTRRWGPVSQKRQLRRR